MVKSTINSSQIPVPRLVMKGISKRFGGTVALGNVNFSVAPGEVHALVGENGAGKSTLMKILSGAYEPDQGVMFLDGQPYLPRNPLDGRSKGVGMIYQELSLAPHLTVEENILLGMEPNTFGFIRREKIRKKTIKALEYFDNPEIRPETKVSELSVSARQLVEIGRSLAVGCRVLVFDEPTSSLSKKDIEKLFDVIRSLKKAGLAIVYISHFLEEIQNVADKLTVLRDGFTVGSEQVGDVSPEKIIQMMVGRKVDDLYPRTNRRLGESVLEIKNLAGKIKPESASLTLHRGEVLGISGLVGAGRTEFLRAIFGLDVVKSGEIKVGIFIGPASPEQRWQQGIGMLSENRKEEGLVLNLNISDNVTLSKLEGFGFLGLVIPKNQDAAAKKWIERFDIRCEGARQQINSLSGGNQQKVALARLLQHDVDILLLDEPTRGIDVAAKVKIYNVINEMASGSQSGRPPKAILMISSYIPELLGVCDRIAVMCRGKLSDTRDIKEVDEHKIMLAATGQEEL